MITKHINFCLVIATVFVHFPTGASECSKVRENMVIESPTNPSYAPGFIILNRTKKHQHSAAVHAFWPYPPRQLLEIIRDYATFSEFMPRVRDSRPLDSSDGRVWVYQRLAFPPPFKDRHYVIESHARNDDAIPGHYRVDWALSSRFDPPQSNKPAVIPAQFAGCWDIRPAAGGGIDAIYSVQFKPGGFIPDWTASAVINRYLEELMIAIEQRLAQQYPPQVSSDE